MVKLNTLASATTPQQRLVEVVNNRLKQAVLDREERYEDHTYTMADFYTMIYA